MKFTLYTADCSGNPKNKAYPHEMIVTSAADLKKAVRFDHVCARYAGNVRSEANFEMSDVLVLDCDNTHSDDPEEWIDSERLSAILTDVAYAIVYSRSHMIPKNGKTARPKMHVYLPAGICKDATMHKKMKRRIQKEMPFFDSNALDAARFFFGSTGEVEWHEGSLSIEDWLLFMKSNRSIPQRQRNATMSRKAGRIVKRFGIGEDAHEKFLEMAAECDPPLDDEELETIWHSACKFGKKVAKQEGYVSPEEYGKNSMIPDDFSDVGEARTLADCFGDELVFTKATDYLRYNGTYWEENEQSAVLAMMEHTDAQLNKADELEKTALERMQNAGINMEQALKGGKKFVESLSDEQLDAYETYSFAKSFKAFVMKYRNMRGLNNALDAAKSLVQKPPEALDKEAMLLNTPGGTYYLPDGMDGWRATNPEDLLTKVTAVVPSDEGMQLWLDALELFFCGDRQLIDYVQMICGLCIVGKVYVESLIIAYGDGRNGKSTFWNVIYKVLGSYSGNMSADALTMNCKRNVKPEMAELKGKRLIIAAELQEGMRLNTSVVKQLCSTDSIFAEKKFKAPFDFEPSHTLILYTNHLPKVGASDDGTWRRLIVIPFHAKITGSADIKNYTQYLIDNAGGAVLKWLIEGAKKVIAANYQIEAPDCVKAAIGSYREDNDWMGTFLSECCEIDKSYTEKSGDLYQEYRNYCAQNGEFTRSTTDFYTALEQAGFSRKRAKTGVIVYGLRLILDDFLN